MALVIQNKTAALLHRVDPARCAATLNTVGYVILDDVPNEDAAEAILKHLLKRRFLVQPGSTIRYKVEAEDTAAHRSSSKSSHAIPVHSDGSSLPVPPKWLALWCASQATGEGGETEVANAWNLISRLPPAQQQLAAHRIIQFGNVHAPIINMLNGCRFTRLSYNLLRYNDYDPDVRDAHLPPQDLELGELAEAIKRLFDDNRDPVKLAPFQLLIINNFDMWHGRSAYKRAEDKGSERSLTRYWIGEEEITS